MRVIVFALLALLGFASPAAARGVITNTITGGGSSYAGPGDVLSGASFWYGLRAYDGAVATAGSVVMNVRRASDNTATNVSVLSSGALNVAAAVGFAGTDATCTATISGATMSVSACASGTLHINDPISGSGISAPAYIASIGSCTSPPGTCTLNASQTVSIGETVTAQVALFVTSLSDQTGNGLPATQSTQSEQPQFLPVCLSGLPCLNFNGSGTWLFAGTTGNVIAAPWSISMVFNSASTAAWMWGATPGADYAVGTDNGANLFSFFYNNSGAVSYAATSGAWHSSQSSANGGLSTINIDGSASSAFSIGASNSIVGPWGVGQLWTSSGGSSGYTGYMTEMGVWPVSIRASGEETALCHNQYLYWGLPTAC